MKIKLKPARQGEKGYALIIVTAFLIVIGITFAGMWLWTSTNGAITQRNNTFNQSAAAAEAATEKVFSQMDRDFLYGNLNTGSYYSTNIPDTSNTNLWPVQYTFSDTNGNTGKVSVYIAQTNFEVLNSQYSGLSGIAQDCTIAAVATPSKQRYNVPATVAQTFQAAIIPVFQFAIFYNLNLEFGPGQPMDIQGPVFCNENIWEGSDFATFESTVQAVGTNDQNKLDPFAAGYQPQTAGATFNLLGQPTDKNNALTLPIGNSTNSDPTNVESILNLPPTGLGVPNAAGNAVTNQIYLYNECDLIISNAFNGTNWGSLTPTGNVLTIYFNDKFNTPQLKQPTNDFYILRTPAFTGGPTVTNFVFPDTPINRLTKTNRCATNVLYAGWSFATNVTFYDFRESAIVQAIQIDVSQFDTWVTNNILNGGGQYNSDCNSDKGHVIGSIYAYNSTPFNPTNLPAVRLVNGAAMPSSYGLTVATPMPLYVYGNYNVQQTNGGATSLGTNSTIHTYPAAILADAVTILSTNWDDVYDSTNEDPTGTTHGPGDTTVNAAMLEGIVPSFTDSGGTGHYSGGVENFLRLLEDWGSTGPSGHRPILTYNGSIVVMFPSIYATNLWGNSGYYGVPARNWAFDLNFKTASGLPPLSPSSRALIRNNWSAY